MEGEPHRPELILWLELPGALIVGFELVDPRAEGSLRDVLLRALERPTAGPPRRPARLRVADAASAAEVHGAVSGAAVRVAPTPELDLLAQDLLASLPGGAEAASYLEGGRVCAGAVAALFEAAERLYRIAPWRIAHESQILRLDIPQLDVAGACVSIIGELGESRGFLIFPSLDAFDAFAAAAEASGNQPLDLGTTLLGLTFESAAELPQRMRREAARHGWPVAEPRAYPRVEHRDRDGSLRPTRERDVRIVTACASALGRFLGAHRKLFKKEFPRPVSENYTDEAGCSVRITAPYPDDPADAPGAAGTPVHAGPKVGRNAPCPCGSGAKYKKCCLAKEEARAAAAGRPAVLKALDERLVQDLVRFADARCGDGWRRAAADFEDPLAAAQLFFPWSVFGFRMEAERGRTVAEQYAEERGRTLTPAAAAWLRAQTQSWLSIWEVLAVEPGLITLRDLLSGEERAVHDFRGSQGVVRRDAVLARVVRDADCAVFCGLHPRLLPPLDAAEVVRCARLRLRRQTAVPLERLRDGGFGRYLIRRWEAAVQAHDRQREIPPVLKNTDGDDLLLTIDHFAFEPAQRERIAGCLRSMKGVAPPPDAGTAGNGDAECYTFLRAGNRMHASWENTVVGRVVMAADTLRIECNSVRRASGMRRRIERACADLVRHVAREHKDSLALMSAGEVGASPAPDARPEARDAVRELKMRHYEGWLDAPLPGLDGETPRQAAQKKAGRARVDALVKHFENHESRLPPGEQADLSGLRTELGLGLD